ncbi:AaceriAGL049Cp [[Ashbya] aceris (nom. inval.)]|nr:AaceriAGL049Cp [[Ashbya] aceris (nom. inval.)]
MIHQMAPWVPIFVQSVKNHPQPFTPFSFSTVDPDTLRPRCRTVVFRDFLFHDRKTNILTFTTDLRGEKVKEIGSYPGKRGTLAPFEGCFYFPQTGEQYRISGSCFVLSEGRLPEVSADYDWKPSGPGVIPYPILAPSVCGHNAGLMETLAAREAELADYRNEMAEFREDHTTAQLSRISTQSSADDIVLTVQDYRPPSAREWKLELQRQWAQLSRNMKSQFRRPHPGTPLTTAMAQKLDKIQRGVDGAGEDTGLENFGLVCLCVDQVDYLNLTNGSGGERWRFTRTPDEITGFETWQEQEICP